MQFLEKHKSIFINFILVFVLIFLDQISKQLAVGLSGGGFSLLGFSLEVPIKNYGFIFGLDFYSNHLFIKPALTAIFIMVLFYYVVFLLYIPKKFYYLQIGLSLLFAGFTSNLINKFVNFYVLDFIKWSPFNLYFNLSDMFQTLGWIAIFSQIIKLKNHIWKKNERRKSFLAIKKFQIQFLAYCSSIFVLVSAFFIILNYQIMNYLDLVSTQEFKQFGFTFFSYCFFLLVIVYFSIGLFFLYFSNKIFGPVYAFERYMKKLLNNKEEVKEDFKLRKNDQFKQLETLAKEIKNKLK
ncbi:MAG: signal peptidase II [Bdellovibrionaceae bacterium]|nr:signal peptidase II [Pseudobdellovibrionaceae bacterium]